MNLPYLFFSMLAGLILAVHGAPCAKADDYPTRPITLVVPLPAGSNVDVSSRLLGAKLADRFGRPVIVENRPGAATAIGASLVARAPPDGYTLLAAVSTTLANNGAIFKKLSYDPVKDFVPVSLISQVPFVLVVNSSLPVHSIADLIKLAKEKPGQLSFGSAGPGSSSHLYMEVLKDMTAIEMTHVSYKGTAPAITDVAGGHIQLMFCDIVSAFSLIEQGKVRALGVSSLGRVAMLPTVLPLAEAGLPGFDAAGWTMIVAPASTPLEIVNKLHDALKKIVQLPELQKQMAESGIIPSASLSPEELKRFVQSEILRWSAVVNKVGLAGSE